MATSKLSSIDEKGLEPYRLPPIFWWDSSKWGFVVGIWN